MEDILNQILLLFGNAILVAITGGLGFGIKWLAEKIKSEKGRSILLRLKDLSIKIARETYTGYVKEIKRANADGRLTKEEKDKAKQIAISSLRSHLGMKGLKEIMWLISGKESGIDDYLSTVIEDAVHTSKNEGRLARNINPTQPQ